MSSVRAVLVAVGIIAGATGAARPYLRLVFRAAEIVEKGRAEL